MLKSKSLVLALAVISSCVIAESQAFGSFHRFPHYRPFASAPSLFERDSYMARHPFHSSRRRQGPPPVQERRFEVRDAGEQFEIHVQAYEPRKQGLFEFDVNLEEHTLAVTDRYNPKRFDKVFTLPHGVSNDDLSLQYLRDRIIIFVQKPQSSIQQNHHAAQPQHQEQTYRKVERHERREQDTKAKSCNSEPRSQQQVNRKHHVSHPEIVEQDGLTITMGGFEDEIDSNRHEPNKDASDGYYDNRGVFHHY